MSKDDMRVWRRWLFVSFHEPYYTSAGTFQMGTYFKVRLMEVSFYQPSRLCRVLEGCRRDAHQMQHSSIAAGMPAPQQHGCKRC